MLKKSLSVFLAVIMMLTACTVGFYALADEFDYAVQYELLAEELKNEHVRTLTNYKVTNTTLDNGAEGFDTDANAFAYEHRVVADDDFEGSIMKAANTFFYIAEHLMSTQYGVGYYSPSLLLEQITEKISPYFSESEKLYVDFYGNRYKPTEEELAAYNAAVAEIEASDEEVTQSALTNHRIFFLEKDVYEYYNVAAVLKMFLGNTVSINTGNWYHRFAFIVNTSVDTAVRELGYIDDFTEDEFRTRTGVYEWSYSRYYNEERAKAYYAFKAPSLSTVFTDYGAQFDLDSSSADVRYDDDGDDYISPMGQAGAFLIKEDVDTTTIPMLRTIFNAYEELIANTTGDVSWDQKYAVLSDDQLKADENYAVLTGYIEDLTSEFSNDALLSVFGEEMGNIITAAYVLTPSDKMPARNLGYTGGSIALTRGSLNEIIYDLDGLVTPRAGSNNERDKLVAEKVATVVKMFFDTTNDLFKDTAIYGMEFSTLNELVGLAVQGLLFNDKIVNLLVGLLYPLICDLLEDEVYSKIIDAVGKFISDIAEGLIDNIIENNDLAIKPSALADRLQKDYPENCKGKWKNTVAILKSHGDNWYVVDKNDEDYGEEDYKGNTDWVNSLEWGIDNTELSKKGEAFTEALCAGLGGFMRLLVTVMCGDYQYTDNFYGEGDSISLRLEHDEDQFNEYFDKKLLSLLIETGWLRSQGGYTKVIIPLFRVLGLQPMADGTYSGRVSGYVSSHDYHALISNKGNYNYANSLKLIVQPIVYFVTDILGKHPFQTLMELLPNLVNFFIREGTDPNLDSYKNTWKTGAPKADSSHKYFEAVQTFNLLEILDSVRITIDLTGIYTGSIDIDSIAGLIDEDDLLGSVNGLLNEVLDLSYKTDIVEKENVAAYMDPATGEILPIGSEEYTVAQFEGRIEEMTPLLKYYSNEDGTSLSSTEDDEHQKLHDNISYKSISYRIPAIPEAKLVSCGTIRPDWNTVDVDDPGVVFLFLLRYVISALGYRYDNTVRFENAVKDEDGNIVYMDDGVTPKTKMVGLPYLIECFGLDMEQELFEGLTLGGIIYNVMLHPDEAIWSLLELFYSHETGQRYNRQAAYTFGTSDIIPNKSLKEIDYHRTVLTNKNYNPSGTYGKEVKYTQYWTREYAADVVNNVDEFVTNILIMLGMSDFKDGIGPYLENLLNTSVFTNDLLNTLFNVIYQLLGGLNDSVGIDLEQILYTVLDVSYSTDTVAAALKNMLGYETEAYEKIYEAETWTELFTVGQQLDENGEPMFDDEGNPVPEIGDIELDWGLDDTSTDATRAEKFVKTACALLSPAAFAIRFLFMNEELNILSLIKLPSYAGYNYALIPLLEALSCPDILTYDQYVDKCNEPVVGNANSIYYILSPILGLLDELYARPVDTLLSLLPNLLFVISVGGLNDIVNNLVHFAYVLLDILKPILNGYDLLAGLLANIEVSGVALNLALPLDLDFDELASELLGALLGDAISIEGVTIALPYIDFHTLCCGKLDDKFSSKQGIASVRLDSASGGDMITALLRIVFETLFMEENEQAIAQLVANAADNGEIDNYDKATIVTLVDKLFGLLQTYEVPDMLLFVVYFLVNKLTPISGTLASRLSATGMTITSLFENISDVQTFIDRIMLLVNVGETTENPDGTTTSEETPPMKGFGSLWERIVAFFKKIGQFFKNLFK